MKQNELNIRDIFAELKHRIVWVILAVVVAGFGCYLYSASTSVQTYMARVSFFVTNTRRTADNPDISNTDITTSARLVDSYIAVLKTRKVMDQIAEGLPAEMQVDGGTILSMVRTVADKDTEKFSVYVTAYSSEEAIAIANQIYEDAPDAIREITRAGEATALDRALTAAPSRVDNVTPAILGGIGGLALSCLVIIIIFSFNTTIWDETDLEKRYDIPVFGTIPRVQSTDSTPAKQKGGARK